MEAVTKREGDRCRYVADGAALIAAASALALGSFILARCSAVDKRPYVFCVIAALSALALAASHHRASYTSRVFPLAAYGSYTAISALAYLADLDFAGAKDVPLFLFHAVRVVSTMAMCVHLAVNGGERFPLWGGRRYWFTAMLALLAAPLLDLLLAGTAVCLPDVLEDCAFFELLYRAAAEFWLAVACLTLIQPRTVTINYGKLGRLMGAYLAGILAGFFVRFILCFPDAGEIPTLYLVNSAFLMGSTLFIGIWESKTVIQGIRYKPPPVSGCLRAFCSSRWFFSCEDVRELSRILLKLEYISREKEKLRKQPETISNAGRRRFLEGEEEELLIELGVKYRVHACCQTEGPNACRRRRKTAGRK